MRKEEKIASLLFYQKTITSKLLIYPSEIFYIEAFKYISQQYIRKYFIYRNSTYTNQIAEVLKHWEIKIPLCS